MKKKWYSSRGVWLGIATFLIGSLEVVRSVIESGDYSALAILTAVAGVLKVFERITSTGESIA